MSRTHTESIQNSLRTHSESTQNSFRIDSELIQAEFKHTHYKFIHISFRTHAESFQISSRTHPNSLQISFTFSQYDSVPWDPAVRNSSVTSHYKIVLWEPRTTIQYCENASYYELVLREARTTNWCRENWNKSGWNTFDDQGWLRNRVGMLNPIEPYYPSKAPWQLG